MEVFLSRIEALLFYGNSPSLHYELSQCACTWATSMVLPGAGAIRSLPRKQ